MSKAVPDQRFITSAFVGFTIFALCFQGIFYLFEYRNGGSLAPTYIKIQKDIVWAVVLSITFYACVVRARAIDALRRPYNLILIVFCVWVVGVKAHEVATYGTTNPMLLTLKNLLLYAAMVPLLSMLTANVQRDMARQILIVLIAGSLVQAAFSAMLFVLFPELAFWKDDPYHGFDPFVGLLSNPNRFSLFLNMGAAALCAALVTTTTWRALLAAAGLVALALGIFYSAALSQLIVYFGTLGYATMITSVKMRWRSLRLPAVMIAAILAIGLVGLNFKSPMPDETHTEAELAWDLRNIASMVINGRTIDGKPFRFRSDSFINRIKEIADLMESFSFGQQASAVMKRKPGEKTPMAQRLFGRPDHLAPASQSQFAYFYFRYGIVGLFLLVAVLAIPAARSLLIIVRPSVEPDRLLLSYHLCLVAFIATFLGDNGLLDFPTNFLVFFVLSASQSLTKQQAELSRRAS